tara:strand:+ start:538 stop:741 length:204 start_codon:yes stop_codon:yes gene_type:complete
MNPAEKQKVTSGDISPTINKGVIFLRQDRNEAVNCLERVDDRSVSKQQPGIAQAKYRKCSNETSALI